MSKRWCGCFFALAYARNFVSPPNMFLDSLKFRHVRQPGPHSVPFSLSKISSTSLFPSKVFLWLHIDTTSHHSASPPLPSPGFRQWKHSNQLQKCRKCCNQTATVSVNMSYDHAHLELSVARRNLTIWRPKVLRPGWLFNEP